MSKNKPIEIAIKSALTAFFCITVIIVLSGFYPFGENTMLTGDLGGIYNPFYVWLGHSIRSGEPVFYSFQKSLGGGTFGLTMNLPVSLSTVAFILMPPESYPVLHLVFFVLRITAAAGFFSYYIASVFFPENILNLTLSLCYSLMAWSFVYSQNTMWMGTIVLLPIALLSLEKLIENGHSTMLPITVALMFFQNYYTAFMASFFLVLYFFCRVYILCMKSKEILSRLWRFGLLGIAGFFTTCVILLPSLTDAFISKGIASGSQGFSSLFRYRPSELARQLLWYSFTWDQVENGLPVIFCSVFSGIALIFSFCDKRTAKRKRLAEGVLLVFLFFSSIFAPLDRFWHLLRDPVWFPFRWSFLISTAVLIIAAGIRLPEKKNEVTLPIAISLIYTITVCFCAHINGTGIKELAAFASLAAFYTFAAAFPAYKPRIPHKLLSFTVLAVVAAELSLNCVHILTSFEYWTYDDYMYQCQSSKEITDIVNADNTGGEGILRAEKDSYRTLNDPMMYEYNGLNYFTSVQDENTVAILDGLGYGGLYRNPSSALPPANALLRIKHFFTTRPIDLISYKKIAQAGDFTVYRSESILPAGIMLKEDDTENIADDPFENINNIYLSFEGVGQPLFSDIQYLSNSDAAVYSPSSGGECYLLCDPSVNARLNVNDKEFYPYFMETTGIVDLGYHDAGEKITIQAKDCKLVSIACLDVDTFNSMTKTLNEINITEPSKEDGLMSFKYKNGKSGAKLLLPMPYDSALKCRINGIDAETEPEFGVFTAIKLADGENNITLRYLHPAFAAGCALSVCGTVSIIIYCAVIKRKQYEKKQTKIQSNI